MIGYHVVKSLVKGPRNNIENSIEYALHNVQDTSVVQIFVAGPQSTKLNLDSSQIDSLKEFVERSGVKVISHGTYMDRPWKLQAYVINLINSELRVCKEVGIHGLVFHVRDQPPDLIKTVISRLKIPESVMLFLENEAMISNKHTYNTPENIAFMLKFVDHPNVGFCVDIAHLHASGIGLESFDDAKGFFENLFSLIPYNKIMIHLNDNANPMGGGKDEHAVLMKGNIWMNYKHNILKSGLAYLVKMIDELKIPAIVELNDPIKITQSFEAIDTIRKAILLNNL